MSRNGHPADKYVRRLPLVSDEQARLLSDRDAKKALFQEITSMNHPAAEHAPAPPRRTPRRTFVVAATVGALSLATVGWALTTFFASDSTSVACHTSDDTVTVADAVTGDPVVDCGYVWEQVTGDPAPELAAYDNGAGGIEVVVAGSGVPNEWQKLDPGAAQDQRVIQLEAALDDHAEGLRSDCFLLDGAEDVAERELARVGLAEWSVTSERGEADGRETCTYFYVDAATKQVVLVPLSGVVAPEDDVYRVFARDVSAALDADCLTLSAAADRVNALAGDAGVAKDALVTYEVADDKLDCVRADVNVGGRVEVTLRGPAS